MADNTTYTEGSGISVATDDVSGVHHQRIKIEQGSDGTAADIAPTSPLACRPGHPSTGYLTNAAVSIAGLGQQALVTATASQTTRVFRLVLVFHSASTAKFQTASTDLTGAMQFRADDKLILDFDGEPWFVTGSNEAFNINLGSSITLTGFIQYEKSA